MSLCVEREEEGSDRPESPTSSCVSMKSDRSKGKPPEPGPSHTQTKRPEKPTTDDEDWTCIGCGCRNSAEALRCRRSFCRVTKILSTRCTALPLSAADMRKSWHTYFRQYLRDSKVRMLVEDMSTGDPAEDINLVTDAQNIERNIYESANSDEEYCKLINEKGSEKVWERQMKIEKKMKSMGERSTPPLTLDKDEYRHLMDEKRSELKEKLMSMGTGGHDGGTTDSDYGSGTSRGSSYYGSGSSRGSSYYGSGSSSGSSYYGSGLSSGSSYYGSGTSSGSSYSGYGSGTSRGSSYSGYGSGLNEEPRVSDQMFIKDLKMSQCVEREEEGSDRPESLTSSCVSMKSDRSKGKPPEPGPSHTQMKRPAKSTTDDEDWQCGRCYYRNTAEDLRCRRSLCNMTKIISRSWDSITALAAADMRKSWHNDITQWYRDLNVRWLVDYMLTGDPAENITTVTGALIIERNIYKSAISKDEYNKLMYVKMSELRKKKQMMEMEQSAQMDIDVSDDSDGSDELYQEKVRREQSGQMEMKSMDQTSTPPLPPRDKSNSSTTVSESEKKDTPAASTVSGQRCVAMFDSEAEHDHVSLAELTFCQGDVITVQEYGSVKIIQDPPPPSPTQQQALPTKIALPGLTEWGGATSKYDKKQSGQMEMKSMDQTSTLPFLPGDKGTTHPDVVSGTKLKEEKRRSVKQKGRLTASSSTAEEVKHSEMVDTLDQKTEKSRAMVFFGRMWKRMRGVTHSEIKKTSHEKNELDVEEDRRRVKHSEIEETPEETKELDEERDRRRVKHSEIEETPEETKELDEERDRRRVKHDTEISEEKSEGTLFDPPSTPGNNPPIQSEYQPHFYPLDPIKHPSIPEAPSPSSSTSSDSTLNRPHMASSQRTQDRKRGEEELKDTDLPSSNLPLLPSSTSDESDIPSSQDAPQEVITPNMYPSVVIVSPMLSSSSTSQQTSHDSPEEMMSSDTACDLSTTDQPVTESLSSVHHSVELQDATDLTSCFSGLRIEESISLPCSHSVPSLSQIPCLENKAGFRAKRSYSVNDVTLLNKAQKITPDIIVVENEESYRIHCTQAGLFQCNVTDLVFKMKTEGDVTYRTVPWGQRLLYQLDKRPAGPLFDIKGSQGSVCQLRFPHCEILSMGGGKSLSVVHVKDDDSFELIKPHVITETHVIINVTGLSIYGIIMKMLFWPSPVQALVSLFYTPPIDEDDDPSSILNVLLLPGNVARHDMLKERRSIREEIYIEKPSCELIPNHEYTLSTFPQDDSITIEPNKAKFKVDESSYHNYISTFEVTLEAKSKHVKLLLRHSNTSDCAWERCVKLSAPSLRKQQVQRTLTLPVEDRLFSVRSSFINSVSDPVLISLLDKLLEKGVITKEEYDTAYVEKVKQEKARVVIDTVRNKGTAASSIMILFLCETDPFLSEHLGLILKL